MVRMPRPPRRESESGVHHVMNRGVDRQPIFTCDSDRLDFGDQLAWMHDELGVDVLAYCLMTNHYHLVLRAEHGSLSEAMHHLGSVYAHRHNARSGRIGPVFNARFHSIPVEDDAYLLAATRYVHLNALDVAGVDHPADYRWSSYRTYLGLRPAPAFLDTSLVSGLLGDSVERLVWFTEESIGDGRTGLGPRSSLTAPSTVAEVVAIVRCAIAVEDLARGTEGALRGLERTLLVLLASRLSNPALGRSVDADLGHPSPGALRVARHRAEQRLATDPRMQRLLAWCEASLGPATSAAA